MRAVEMEMFFPTSTLSNFIMLLFVSSDAAKVLSYALRGKVCPTPPASLNFFLESTVAHNWICGTAKTSITFHRPEDISTQAREFPPALSVSNNAIVLVILLTLQLKHVLDV